MLKPLRSKTRHLTKIEPGFMNTKNKTIFLLLLPAIAYISCNRGGDTSKINTVTSQDTVAYANETPVTIPAFNADSAYNFIKTQVSFGPRVPGTKAHEECLHYFLNELKRDSLQVKVQTSSARVFTGKVFRFENIIVSAEPQSHSRIVLFGHWDSRPFADQDSVDPLKPFDAADDGGSSAAMLLEIARHLHRYPPAIGVDLVFIDLEDYGQQGPIDGNYPVDADSWCLGSQNWANNLPPNYAPRFGILLDMVGGKNAVFPMEGTSMHYAPDIVNKIWNIAAQMGYGNIFTHDITGETIDDHLYINQIAGIPTIDIVDFKVKSNGEGDYPYFHHKHSDNMSVIDTNTLQIVGNLVMKVIYSERKAKGI